MEKTVPRLGPAHAGARLSTDEFASAEFEEPYIYERVRGRLVVMSPAGPEHRQVSRPFRRELGLFWGQHPDLVDDVDVEGWVATGPEDDRIPDICVYLAGESSGQTVPHRVPHIIFEFVSADRLDQERDYIDKRAEYHAIGVQEYVIVDRFKQAVLILTWQPGDFAERSLGRDDVYTTPLLPDLKISLLEVFQ
jgi:Uma2 family endonuclease